MLRAMTVMGVGAIAVFLIIWWEVHRINSLQQLKYAGWLGWIGFWAYFLTGKAIFDAMLQREMKTVKLRKDF